MPLRLDLDPGTEYLLPFAKKKLRELYSLDIINRAISVSSGEFIFVQKGFVDLIRIRGGTLEFATSFTSFELVDIELTSDDMATFGFSDDPPAPFSVGFRAGQLVVSPITDQITVRLGAIKRLIKAKNFEYAEQLVRNMNGDGDELDAALNCDEGFFVDLSLFAAAPYLDSLTAAVGTHAGTFNHDLSPDVGSLFPEIDPAGYLDLGAPFDYPLHQFVHGSPEVLLTATDFGNANTSSVHPYEIASASETLPLATRVTHRRFVVETASALIFEQTFKREDFQIHQVLRVIEDYYDVNASTGSSFHAEFVSLSGAPTGLVAGTSVGWGPVTGYALPRAKRFTTRRHRDGWVVETDAVVDPAAVILPFSMDGNVPANAIAAASGSGSATATHEDGGSTAYATTEYDAADISYTDGASQLPTYLVDGSLQPHGDPSIYTGSVDVDGAPDTLIKARFTSLRGRKFELTLLDTLKVVSSGGTETVSIPEDDPPDVGSIVALDHISYTYPDAATYSDSADDAEVDVELWAYQPSTVTLPLITPPVNGDLSCIYQASTDKYLYYGLTGSLDDDDFSEAYFDALFGYVVALGLGNADVIASRKATFLSLIIVVAAGGLPPECAVLNPEGGGTTVIV